MTDSPRHAKTSKTPTRATAARPGARPARPAAGNAAITSGAATMRRANKRRGQKNINWSMVLALSVIAVIIIGVLALIGIGINSLVSGGDKTVKASASSNARIYSENTATPTPQPEATQTPEAPITVPVVNINNANTQAPVQSDGLRSARIRNIGDFVIHKVLIDNAASLAKTTGVNYAYDFMPMIEPIAEVMGNADFTVVNVDGSLGGKKYYRFGYSGYPQFNTPEYLLIALRDAGADMLTLANNHMLDGWYDGLKATMDNIDAIGLKHIGASRTQEERDKPRIFEVNGIKIGFMNYTQYLNEMDKEPSLDKNAMLFGVNAVSNSNPVEDAAALRKAGAEVIVCYMHWGAEYESTPNTNQTKMANGLAAIGVDVIIGGHPHVVQYAKWLSGKDANNQPHETLCLYSMGNFLSDQRTKLRDGGIIFDFTIQERADGKFDIVSPSYLPTWVWRTGTEESGFNYKVLLISDYLNTRPVGMSDADYNSMMTSYSDNIAVMSKGVGEQAYK